MSPTIRRGVPADADVIIDMNARMAQETESKTLDRAILSAGVYAVLADPARGRYFIAERDGCIVGQTMVTFEWSDWRNGWFWWIQSVYVPAEFRRQGIFKALYGHVVEQARQAGDVVGVRLYVERDNDIAQQTYFNLGMERTGYLLLERCPLTPPGD